MTREQRKTTSFSHGYDAWHVQRAQAESSAKWICARDPWFEMVRQRLPSLRALRVAEIGCGRGNFAIELAKLGARVTALDLSAKAIDIARSRARCAQEQIEFVVGDAQDTGLPAASFDLVVSCECLEHVPQPARMANELFRICAPGGRCLLTTPSYLNGQLLAWAAHWLLGRPYDSGAGTQPHENFFLFFIVRRMLRNAGFIVADEDSSVFQWLLLPGVDPARLQVRRYRKTWQNRLARPFGLHFFFDLMRPEAPG